VKKHVIRYFQYHQIRIISLLDHLVSRAVNYRAMVLPNSCCPRGLWIPRRHSMSHLARSGLTWGRPPYMSCWTPDNQPQLRTRHKTELKYIIGPKKTRKPRIECLQSHVDVGKGIVESRILGRVKNNKISQR
jgi:hypothetical protein